MALACPGTIGGSELRILQVGDTLYVCQAFGMICRRFDWKVLSANPQYRQRQETG
jgi:hypothetical protein